MTNEMIETALKSTKGFAVGAKPVLVKGSPLFRAMLSEGLIGANGGLTLKGSIRTEKLKNGAIDALLNF
jgi:hypothetical protein